MQILSQCADSSLPRVLGLQFGVKCVSSLGNCLLWVNYLPLQGHSLHVSNWDSLCVCLCVYIRVCVCVCVWWLWWPDVLKHHSSMILSCMYFILCASVRVCAEPALDGSRGLHSVHSLLGEGGHVQLRPVSLGAADWRNSLRSLETWCVSSFSRSSQVKGLTVRRVGFRGTNGMKCYMSHALQSHWSHFCIFFKSQDSFICPAF